MARKPKYRRHTTRDLGFVEHEKKRLYFPGPYGSDESLAEYRAFLRSRGFVIVDSTRPANAVSLAVLIDRFLQWAEATYPSGRYSHCANLQDATTKLAGFMAKTDAAVSFTPLRLKAFQDWLVSKKISRRYINDTVSRLRFMFKWAVSDELVPVATYQALMTVQGLRRGRSAAKEPPPKKPVPHEHVAATVKKLPTMVRAMVEFQALTGVRSQSVCAAKPCQFTRDGKLWTWKPKHKTEYRGHVLTIFVGPRAQKIIEPFLADRDANEFVFQPRNKSGGRSKKYRSFFDPSAYRTAVRRAAQKARVPHWSPHQLRHSLGTLVREKHGLEAAQAVLGHVRIDATQIYAQKQMELAKMVAAKMG